MTADSVAGWLRAAGYVFIAAGVSRIVLAQVTSEDIDRTGFVSGAVLATGLLAVGAYVRFAAAYVRLRMYSQVPLPIVLAALSMASSLILLARPDIGEIPTALSVLIILIGAFGYGAMIIGISMLLVFVPVVYVLGWAADRLPSLRRRGAGDAIRRSIELRSA